MIAVIQTTTTLLDAEPDPGQRAADTALIRDDTELAASLTPGSSTGIGPSSSRS